MNTKILYSIGLLVLIGLVFFGIYRQRTVQKSASTETASLNDAPVTVEPSVAPTAIPVLTNGGLTMVVTSPPNGQTVTTEKITIKGKTSPLAEVFINDAALVADASGNFSQIITLEEGDNYILVVANDADGNFAEKELSIVYEPAE